MSSPRISISAPLSASGDITIQAGTLTASGSSLSSTAGDIKLAAATSLVFGLAGLRFARSTAEAIAVVERDVTLEQFEARIADPEGEGEACDILSMILYRSSLAEEDAARVGDILAGHLVGPATEGRYSPGPAALLLQLRGEAAMPAILAPEVLSITNPRLIETLWAIRGAGLDLPADRADRMLAALLTVDPLPEQEQALVDEDT